MLPLSIYMWGFKIIVSEAGFRPSRTLFLNSVFMYSFENFKQYILIIFSLTPQLLPNPPHLPTQLDAIYL